MFDCLSEDDGPGISSIATVDANEEEAAPSRAGSNAAQEGVEGGAIATGIATTNSSSSNESKATLDSTTKSVTSEMAFFERYSKISSDNPSFSEMQKKALKTKQLGERLSAI
eukprot:CAMPEP_0181125300 /NCGR_PEP_ID=MMETSP1071-20121207/26961_1 /TAXON_ID=35127 /ORGANISM="Thalassiosira sp., Strain NH16" /LENGTH=111 /DNA_ID=CAMNT_0023210703 /DNA_START=174 /DNA_END=509 /DNA_ORIENTATION=+